MFQSRYWLKRTLFNGLWMVRTPAEDDNVPSTPLRSGAGARLEEALLRVVPDDVFHGTRWLFHGTRRGLDPPSASTHPR